MRPGARGRCENDTEATACRRPQRGGSRLLYPPRHTNKLLAQETGKAKSNMTDSPTWDPLRLLVTGYSGFVGRHFCSRYGGVPFSDQDGNVDLRDAKRVQSAVTALMPEAVLHLAAQSSVASSFDDPDSTFSVNFLGTLNLLRALSAAGFQGALLYVGSADVYGRTAEADLPTGETQPLRPRSPYAVSKVAAEALCYQWSQTHGFRIVLTRPFNQIGPGQDKRFAVSDFAHQIVEIRSRLRPPLMVTGDLDVTRDFTDVRDATRAYKMLLEKGRNGEVYNICSGQERSLRSLLEELLRIAGVSAEPQTKGDRLRPVEQRRVIGDPSKIHAQLGWSPEITLTTTLTDVLRGVEESHVR
jgi:GDP-4-dehydro-6-deoxy-D-mannose reductase